MRGFSRIPLLAVIAVAVACSDGHMPTGIEPITPPVQPEVAFSEGGTASMESTASVMPDKDDYLPGDLVTITGAGWAPGETVHLHIEEDPATAHNPHSFYVEADGEGNWTHAELVMDQVHLGVHFTLTATGQSSGLTAQTTFTDGNNFTVSPASQSVQAGSVSNFTWTFTSGSSANVATSTFTIPGGWTAPQAAAGPGQVTVSGCASNVAISGMVITITQSGSGGGGTCGNGQTLTINYLNVTAPTPATPPQTYTFVFQHGIDPTVTVNAAATPDPRSTTTTIECTPDPVAVNEGTTCTATVTDTDDGAAVTPTGTVESWSSTAPGTFDATSCALVETALGTASCDIGYTPAAGSASPPTHEITAAYSPTSDHAASDNDADPFELEVAKRATTVTVTCSPAGVVVHEATECTVTVEDVSGGTKITPSGTATFASDASGSFDPASAECSLSETVLGTASCGAVDYTPGAAGTHNITASFPGGSDHIASDNDATPFSLTVNERETKASVTCVPAAVVVNEETECTVTVEDVEEAGTKSEPVGDVNFTVTGGSSDNDDFDSASCTLVGSGDGESSDCSVKYTPSAASTHVIRADYGPDGTSTDVHEASYGTFDVTVNKRETATSLVCAPEVQKVGLEITCTAIVTDEEDAGTKAAPQGNVEYERNGVDSGFCTLVAIDAESSSCSIDITSPVPTVDDMQAFYEGPSNVHDSSESGIALAVFYDPEAGFVTGGGWIHSMPGHYRGTGNEDLQGKATFGFVSKYKKGANVPDGNTQFVFHAGNLNFHSSQYEWLVVNQNGANAQFKGVGKLNGQDGYRFMIWATDGSPDSFRIKIWYGDENSPVYDNDGEQQLGGGSIVIHTGGNGKK